MRSSIAIRGRPTPVVEVTHLPAAAPSSEVALARWTLLVRDNGLGIAPEHQRTIFGRFVRAHAHLDEELGVTGSGLGLSIVADCVEAMGGTITCESAPGDGTTFKMQLPLLSDAPA